MYLLFQQNAVPKYDVVFATLLRKLAEKQDEGHWISARYLKRQKDHLHIYSMLIQPQTQKNEKEKEDLVYTRVIFTHRKTT